MLPAAALLILQLAVGVFAATNSTICNADNCLRAVRASSHAPGPSSGKADCSSFMRKTVTPCPVTITTKIQVTATATPIDVTQTTTLSETSSTTITIPETTTVATADITATTTVTSSVTETDIVTVTLTTTTDGGILRKRDIITITLGGGASTCSATTNTPSGTPAYASACSGTVRYSSACSCVGVTGTTTTLPQSTVVATDYQTTTVTPTATVQATATNVLTSTITTTLRVSVTLTTTVTTVTSQASSTVATITSTLSTKLALCTETSYNFMVVGGTYDGQYIYNTDPSDPQIVTYNFVKVGATLASAHQYVVRSNGHVYGSNNLYGWATINSDYYYVLSESDASQQSYGSPYISCSIQANSVLTSSVPGALGQLKCSRTDGQATYLISCPNVNQVVYQAPQANALGGPCVPLNIVAIPVGVVSC